MDTTLIVYEKRTQAAEFCALIERVLGPDICVEPQGFDGSFDGHSAVAIVFSLDEGRLPGQILRFIERNAEQLKEKRVALVCISANRASAGRVLKSAAHKLSDNVAFSVRISPAERPKSGSKGLNRTAFSESCSKLIALRRALAAPQNMPQEMLSEHIGQILQSHNTCALCTGHDGSVRATPIEYVYQNGALYFLSEGGEKFAQLYANPKVAVAVFDAYSGFDKLEGVQIEGSAVTIEIFCEEYNSLVASKGLSADNLRKLPVKLNMFKVVPERIEVLKSSFAKEGFAPKQVWTKKL